MKVNHILALALAGSIACGSCGGGDDDGAGDDNATGGAGQGGDGTGTAAGAAATATGGGSSLGGAGGAGSDPCEAGCVETLAANCDRGPASATECVSDCRSLMEGACGTEYRALQTCSEGEPITCDAQGLPVIEACATEQGAFVACLG